MLDNEYNYDDDDIYFRPSPRVSDHVVEKEKELLRRRQQVNNYTGTFEKSVRSIEEYNEEMKKKESIREQTSKYTTELLKEHGLPENPVVARMSVTEMMSTWFEIDDEVQPQAVALAASGHSWNEISEYLGLGIVHTELSEEEYEKLYEEQRQNQEQHQDQDEAH